MLRRQLPASDVAAAIRRTRGVTLHSRRVTTRGIADRVGLEERERERFFREATGHPEPPTDTPAGVR